MLEVKKTELDGVLILYWKSKEDNRGLKIYTHSKIEMNNAGIKTDFVEEAIYKIKKKNTLYGIHFQNNPKPQTKLVYCLKGRGTDFIIDLRKKSATYK